ncbi:MAG: sulfur acceptor protein CsdL [Gammaproteobacteria bacterium (ex Lamellibrachia satsuma)]|nr:MAG: tRNA cyclic N6-threonylcarbamoyladenosine(37) synthase TcdA [Gammaproteobacteria bacterium (ex Lamellibrachia satsuma)]RRS32255.1 MAG: sulfur acceptor protein CsdL [Gammaproteobacteria bacterium (ex Lamellibrachia satsuma)]RRS33261.1 MAG: sulfur acceptor protein CsdL [Gammaproteobacteria bacterium (ex Lamellibrachia satsuma)]
MDHSRRFGGIGRLYGQLVLENYSAAHVCVIGIGGVGSWAVEALARSGIGAITLVDLDHIAESNINRQLHALDTTLGMAKVEAMAERVSEINPDCRVSIIESYIEADNLELITDGDFDYVIDCIDSFRVKAALIVACRRQRVGLITIGGAGGQTDPTRICLADLSRTRQDPLLAKTRKLLRREYGYPAAESKRRFHVPSVYSTENLTYPDETGGVCDTKPGRGEGSLNCGGYGSAMTVTATFGLVAVSHVLKVLAAGKRA